MEAESIGHLREPEDSLGTVNQNQIIVNQSELDVLNSLQLTNQNVKEEAEIQIPTSFDQNLSIFSEEDSAACIIDTSKDKESINEPEMLEFESTSSEQTNKTPTPEEIHLSTEETIPKYVNKATYQSYSTQGSGIFRLSQTSNPKFILLFRYPTIQPIVEEFTPFPLYKTPRYAYGPSYRSAPSIYDRRYRSRKNPLFYQNNPWLSQSSPYAYTPRHFYSGIFIF